MFTRASKICFRVQETLKCAAKKKTHAPSSRARIGDAARARRRKGALFCHHRYREFRNIASPEVSCRLAGVSTSNTPSPKPTTEVGVLLKNDQITNLDQMLLTSG